MHLLSRHHTALQALSASSLSPTSFSAVDAHGRVSLWDVRLKKPNYLTMNSSSISSCDGIDGHSSSCELSSFTDIVYYAHCDKVITTIDRKLEVFDVRMTLSSLSTYNHSFDLIAMYYGNNSSYTSPIPHSLQHALVVDENGSIVSIDVESASVDHVIDECVFGELVNINQINNKQNNNDDDHADMNRNDSNVALFGKLNNLCSAIGTVQSTSCQSSNNINNDKKEHLLFTIDMTGHGALYDRNLQFYNFTLCNAINNESNDNNNTILEETTITNSVAGNAFNNDDCNDEVCANSNTIHEENVVPSKSVTRSVPLQFFNPPLVNCCAFDNENSDVNEITNSVNPLVALGHANGTYDVLTINFEHKCIVELMSAPGHACNGLIYTSWVRNGVLLTTSICGDISVWDIKQFLANANANDDEDDDEELPTLLDAYSHRDLITPCSAQVNACIRLSNTSYLIADTIGNVSQCNIAL